MNRGSLLNLTLNRNLNLPPASSRRRLRFKVREHGVKILQTAYVQVRAWEASKGATYEAAQAAGGKHGSSATITVVTGGDLVVPSNLIGLQGFRLQLSTRPSIVAQPQPVTVGLGGSARFEVTAGGSGPFTYQWKKGTTEISGARSRAYEIPSVNAGHAGTYSVRVSNAFGFIDSNPATLVIAPLPVITDTFINPASPLVGRALRLEVVVQGDGPITYQWRRNGNNISGATLSSYESSAAEAGTYSVRITGPGGSLQPNIVTVSPNYALSLVPLGGGSINANPPGAYQPPGTTVQLTAVPDNGYRFNSWLGAVTGTANPVSLVMNDHKSVEAVFSPAGGTIFFANRNIGQGLDARVFDTDGATPLSGPGFVAQLYAGSTAENLGPIGPSVPFLTGDGAGYFRSEDRSIATIQPGQTAYVQIRAWSPASGATYEAARLANGKHGANLPIPVITGNLGNPPTFPTVPKDWTSFKLQIGSAPQFLAQPKPQQLGLGSTARFEVQVSGSEPLTFQWRKGTAILPNSNSRILEIRNVSATDEGSYSVRVSNSQGFAESDPATLRIVTVYSLTLASTGPGHIVATPESSDGFDSSVYLPNTTVTLQALPDGISEFVRWEAPSPGPSIPPPSS
jgi:hypothetical protein